MRSLALTIIFSIAISFFSSCERIAPARELYIVDSLNQVSYAFHYRNLDSSFRAAKKAYELATFHRTGKAEAANNLGFYAFMQMDFEQAEEYFNEVYRITENELELLIADVGMMKICQRTARNKEFYDYRNSALKRIKRIDEEKNRFVEKHEKTRLNYAYTEFSIVSAIYYYYLQQIDQAISSINEIKPESELKGDTAQLLYYHYIKGASSLEEDISSEQKLLNEFDELFYTWRLASAKNFPYFEANGLQGLANLLIYDENFQLLQRKRGHLLTQLEQPVDSATALRLAQRALKLFNAYDDIYQIAETYVSIGRYLNQHGEYAEALDTLSKALDYVNLHHRRFYAHEKDSIEWLKPYVERDSAYLEILWMSGKDETLSYEVKTVPEWISRIREQLSVSYSGLGMKFQADYNRSIYIEILRYTRQDKELESRYALLREEEGHLNLLLLFITFGLILFLILLFVFNTQSKKRERIYSMRLQLVLDICQKVTASIPSDITNEKEIPQAITTAILPQMHQLVNAIHLEIILPDEPAEIRETSCSSTQTNFDLFVPDKAKAIAQLIIFTPHRLSKDEFTLIHMITPAIAWTIDNGLTFIALGDERERLDKQRYVIEQHIAKNKRENIIKKACLAIVTGIIPYIDRIINEVRKLKGKKYHSKAIKEEKYHYVRELVEVINEQNDILSLWIKLKQGSLNLNVENFELNELFELVKKGRKTFEMRKQTLIIRPTDAIVKADKALTLFMINTLTENARKYTQKGGEIKVYAETTPDYVEISIEDNGRGLSTEDVATINEEKIYDSRKIGVGKETENEDFIRLKGSGYGIMNCKGIIEKYRKSNSLFNVCLFKVESKLGLGSRFFFRLPIGIYKRLSVILAALSFTFMSCSSVADVREPADLSLRHTHNELNEKLIERASALTDTAYYCNLIEEYGLGLQYLDSAITCLNAHYAENSTEKSIFLSLQGDSIPAEMIWKDEAFKTDYYVIMDIRNAAAVSYLALKQWKPYAYNNKAFEALYKLTSEDRSLEAYCIELERSTSNKIVGIIICLLLLVSYIIIYYFLYIRKRMMNRWRIEHVLEINKSIFSSSLMRTQDSIEALQREENTLREIPRRIIESMFDGINEWLDIDRLSLAIYNETNEKWEFASTSADVELPDIVALSFKNHTYLHDERLHAFPLLVEIRGEQRCVGVLFLEQVNGQTQENDVLLLELISRYVAIVVLNAVVKLANRYRDIESAYEDAHRASWEDSLLHVQNLVLDNCLSTIKHETIYYPNKIKQIVEKLTTQTFPEAEETEHVEAISELIEYYKGIFTMLSSNASRQLEEVTFRRATIRVSSLLEYAEKYFNRNKKQHKELTLQVRSAENNLQIIGDINLMQYLFENLIQEALSHKEKGMLCIEVFQDGEFVRFVFTDMRRNKHAEELTQIFSPDLKRMTMQKKGELQETEFLICKQIIREHDEYAGRRGCRINSEPAANGEFMIYFTLPKR